MSIIGVILGVPKAIVNHAEIGRLPRFYYDKCFTTNFEWRVGCPSRFLRSPSDIHRFTKMANDIVSA